MRRTRRLISAAVALCLFPAVASAQPYFGFNDNSVVAGDLTAERDAELLAGAGADAVRLTIDWSWVEHAPGTLDLSLYDPIYDALIARGVKPVFIVMGAPRWAWPPWVMCLRGHTCHYPPGRTHDQAWAGFVGAVAQRYPEAAAIEVWNEPNLRGFWGGAPDPERYTELLRLGHQAVKAHAPGMPVLGGSLAPVLDEQLGPERSGIRPFLRAMYAAGARGLMDGISLHPYPFDRPHSGTYEAIDLALAERDAAGDESPLWLTELGIRSSQVGLPRQAMVLGDLVPRLMRRPEVEAVMVHTLVDPRGRFVDPSEDGYGVVTSAGRYKPAYCALARAVGGPVRCPAPAPTAPMLDRWAGEEALQQLIERALAHHRRTGEYAPGRADGVRLCARWRSGRERCVTIVDDGPWQFEW